MSYHSEIIIRRTLYEFSHTTMIDILQFAIKYSGTYQHQC